MRLERVAIALAALVTLSSSALAQMSAGRSSVTIATATPGGNYFLTGNALCRALQRQGHYLDSGDVTLLNCAALASAGSIQNVDLLRTGAADAALMQSDWQHHAFTGADRFAERKFDKLRALVSLNPEAFQVLAARGTRIAAWDDLKAKKVNLGPAGSTSYTMFQELFRVHGVDEKWLTQALRLPPSQHVQEMCEGNIEALGQTSGVPNSGVLDAIRRCGADLVRLDTPEIVKLVDDKAYYTPLTIPMGTYPGQREDIPTFAVVATLVATTDMSDSIAYSIVRALFEGLPDMAASVPVLRGLDQREMLSAGLSAPLHPGALRYFKERGWTVPIRAATTSAAPAPPPAAPSPPAQAVAPLPAASAPLPSTVRGKQEPTTRPSRLAPTPR